MADKNFKVKKNIQVTDLAVAGPVTVDSSGVLASSSALAVSLGGTGQTSATAALSALLPTQTNNANKLLGTNGTSASWVSPGIAYQTSAPDNPVTGQLWVDSDETGDSLDPYIIRRKTITATAGQTVFTTTEKENKLNINTGNLENGMYFLKFINKGEITTKKINIQH
jgi:hypothetical protein